MAVKQWAVQDLDVFIEYQQVMSEKEIRRHAFARDQVFKTYKDLMQTKPGKALIEGHKAFIEQPKTIGTERSWIETNLKPLLKETPEIQMASRSSMPGADRKLIETVKDHAAALTNPDKLHPHMRKGDKMQHAMGVITHVSNLRKEKNLELSNKLTEVTRNLTNLVTNVLTRNLASKELVKEMMTIEPKQPSRSFETSKTVSKDQGMER